MRKNGEKVDAKVQEVAPSPSIKQTTPATGEPGTHSPQFQYGSMDDNEEMVLRVKTLTGKIILINATRATTVLQFKGLIRGKEGIPPDAQRIIAGGKQLEDGQAYQQFLIFCIEIDPS